MDSTGKVQIVDSSWYLPLPLKEYAMSRVTVYFYSDGWVPIKYCSLQKAVLLSHKAKLEGKEILVFPPDLDPNNFSNSFN
ncbi:MAG: hypothetical protein RMY36_002350 [Nostoc sp. SerVER01]|nr:hypothetical protein [Nostoc sp. SerVER01]MDZ8027316.1 hypothetical protein [Nostoc sp. DedQUE11]MDZ8074539.1 hypothetical protein [Nostoc sp. DedQUE01]MDZ8077664.1 hypothetical protein [Nostoc sp. DcaGUA01]